MYNEVKIYYFKDCAITAMVVQRMCRPKKKIMGGNFSIYFYRDYIHLDDFFFKL